MVKCFLRKPVVLGAVTLVTEMALSASVHAQTAGWEKPITTYATNVLAGIQSLITGLGVLWIIAFAAWGFFGQDPRKYKWALGGVAVIILAQLGPTLIPALTAITR